LPAILPKLPQTVAKAIRAIGVAGNRLPDPLVLFTVLAVSVLFLSWVLERAGVSVRYVAVAAGADHEVLPTTVAVVNLLSVPNLRRITQEFVTTYVTFYPIGLVAVMMMGVAIAERAGLIAALMRRLVSVAPSYLVTYLVSLVGVCANLASDAGIVFAPAFGASVFLACGRHPMAGLVAGYASAYGGYSANLLIAGTDALLAGITQSAAAAFGIDAPIHPLMNWYVSAGCSLFLPLVVTIITERVITPLLGPYDPAEPDEVVSEPTRADQEENERRGLRAAASASVAFVVLLLVMTVPRSGLLRNDAGQLLPDSPLIGSIVFLIFSFFLVAGVAYGRFAGTLRTGRQVARAMEGGLVGVAGFLVICLPASMFVSWLGMSNISTVAAVHGARLLESTNISGIPLLLAFVVFCAALNLFIPSGAAKWLILAPIFVPMFAMVGISPAAAQMAYRIGDSTTNIISPVSAYLPVILGMMTKYRNRGQTVGIGTVISLMLPYSVALFLSWLAFFGAWLVLGLPIGPGVTTFLGR
jgi:aminobenzoyl-glutamate transport protein